MAEKTKVKQNSPGTKPPVSGIRNERAPRVGTQSNQTSPNSSNRGKGC